MFKLTCREGHLLPEYELTRKAGKPAVLKARCKQCKVTVKQEVSDEIAASIVKGAFSSMRIG